MDHRYPIEVDCSSEKFKSAKLKDKEYIIIAPSSSLHWSFDCFLCHFSTNGILTSNNYVVQNTKETGNIYYHFNHTLAKYVDNKRKKNGK